MTTPPFREFFSGFMSWLYLGSCTPNFKFAALAILELFTFNAQKIKGHVTLTTPPFREFFSGVMSGLYLGSCTPNFKFAAFAILELLAFNAQKIKGQILFRGHIGNLVPDVCAKFHQNRLKIETVRGHARTHKSALDIGHRISDTRH